MNPSYAVVKTQVLSLIWLNIPSSLPPPLSGSLSLQASTSQDRNTAALLAACLAQRDETIIGGQ